MLYHGGDYNPEQWLDRPDILEKDIEMMKAAKINIATLGVFSWGVLEPEEGRFDLDWLESIVDTLYKNGISTDLATPSGARPAWMAYKYPEVRRVDANRVRELYGIRHNHCYTSPIYREKVRIIDQKLAERFGGHPGVVQWHISNEFGGECHCPLCQAAFQDWLREKYGTLEALNKAWNARFWSHTYTDWTQIESPAPHGEDCMHGLHLDWKRFVTHQTIDFFNWEKACLREIVPDARVTANMMYQFDQLDYFEFAKHEDIASWDSYPTWHKPTRSDEETALDTALMHDLIYSLKQKPFWLMESVPSTTNWQPVSKNKKPGMHLLSSLQAVAHGSDTVMYFQWRQSRGAAEKFHGAVVGHDGRSDNRFYAETAEIGAVLEKLAEVQGVYKEKQAAIVMDWDNKWALEDARGPRQCGMGYWQELQRHYNGLARCGYTVDFVNEKGSLDGYGLVVAPMLYLLREDFAQKLREFTAAGGTLVVTYWSGVVNETDLCWLGDAPHGLTDVLGLRRAEIDSLYDSETRRCVAVEGTGLPDATGTTLCEIAAPLDGQKSAAPLLVYDEDFFKGVPAVTVNSFGKGKAYYLASRFEKEFYRPFYKTVCKGLFTPAWPEELPQGVLANRRGGFTFLQNFNRTPATVSGITLPAYGLAVWQKEALLGVFGTAQTAPRW